MVHQAKVNTNGRPPADEPNVAASFSGLAHDAIELAELQAQLLKLDAKAAARNGGASLVLAVVGICLLLGCVPVVLLALAEVIVAQYGWSRAGALGAAAAIGFALSAGACAIAWYRLRTGLGTLKRSRDELNRNLAWIKANLKRGKQRSFSDRP